MNDSKGSKSFDVAKDLSLSSWDRLRMWFASIVGGSSWWSALAGMFVLAVACLTSITVGYYLTKAAFKFWDWRKSKASTVRYTKLR